MEFWIITSTSNRIVVSRNFFPSFLSWESDGGAALRTNPHPLQKFPSFPVDAWSFVHSTLQLVSVPPSRVKHCKASYPWTLLRDEGGGWTMIFPHGRRNLKLLGHTVEKIKHILDKFSSLKEMFRNVYYQSSKAKKKQTKIFTDTEFLNSLLAKQGENNTVCFQ